MRCRTVRQHTVDGVTIRYPLMGWRFATRRRGGRVSRPHRLAVPRVSRPTGGTSCFTTHRRRSGRRARPNFGRALPGSRPKFGQRYRCDNLSQPLPAGSVGHGAPTTKTSQPGGRLTRAGPGHSRQRVTVRGCGLARCRVMKPAGHLLQLYTFLARQSAAYKIYNSRRAENLGKPTV